MQLSLEGIGVFLFSVMKGETRIRLKRKVTYSKQKIQKMNKQPTRKVKSADRVRIENAKKQIIQCECIIRKVLAIHNCFEELRNLDRECIL